jgi:hypothetical protein
MNKAQERQYEKDETKAVEKDTEAKDLPNATEAVADAPIDQVSAEEGHLGYYYPGRVYSYKPEFDFDTLLRN